MDDDDRTRSDPHAFVLRCVAEGVPPEDARRELERNGIEPEQARWLVESGYARGSAPAEDGEAEAEPAVVHEPYDSEVLPRALAAGLAAAVAGGIAWTIAVVVSGYELGLVAWAIGGLAGFAVAWAAGARRGGPLQAVAVVSALLGILVGKYGTFAHDVREAFEEIAPSAVPAYWDSEILDLFLDNLGEVFSAFDLLWVGLAVFTAWSMLRPQRG